MGIALLAFIMALPWISTAYYISVGALALQYANSKETTYTTLNERLRYGIASAKKRKKGLGERRREHPEALTSALVEFQKAQCFFMLATNIAGIKVQDEGGLDPTSLQQLYNTYIFIKSIAIGGYLPITFTLFTLHMLDKLSWYLLVLSASSIGVAIATLTMKGTFNPNLEDLKSISELYNSTTGPTSCGSHTITAQCYSAIPYDYSAFNEINTGDGADAILIFCLVTFAILILYHFFGSEDETNQKIRNWVLRMAPFLSWFKPAEKWFLPKLNGWHPKQWETGYVSKG